MNSALPSPALEHAQNRPYVKTVFIQPKPTIENGEWVMRRHVFERDETGMRDFPLSLVLNASSVER